MDRLNTHGNIVHDLLDEMCSVQTTMKTTTLKQLLLSFQVGVHPHELDSVLKLFEAQRGQVDLELFRSALQQGRPRKQIRPQIYLHTPHADTHKAPAPPYRGITRYNPTYVEQGAPGPFSL